MVSDIDNRVRNIVYEFLKELVINKKKVFEYYMIERRIISRLGLSYASLPNDTIQLLIILYKYASMIYWLIKL